MSAKIDELLSRLPCEDKIKLRSELVTVLNAVNTLILSIESLMHNDGTETQYFKLGGTVPMVYMGTKYNIPVDIYISSRHPSIPPLVYVRPTAKMIVKPNHPDVDMDGLVHIPYLKEWTRANTLIALTQSLSAHFGVSPPLFTKPTSAPAPSYPVATPIYNNNNNNTSSGSGGSIGGRPVANTVNIIGGNPTNMRNSISEQFNSTPNTLTGSVTRVSGIYQSSLPSQQQQQPSYSPPPYGIMNHLTPNTQGTTIPMATITSNQSMMTSSLPPNSITTTTTTTTPMITRNKRIDLENELTNRLKKAIRDTQDIYKQDINEEMNIQRKLNDSARTIEQNKKILEDLKLKISSYLDDLEIKNQQLEKWANENEGEKHVKIESFIHPHDDLSEQLIRLSAENKAIDDVIYYLEKGKERGVVDLNIYLREIRRLAHTQFLKKMHMMKINASINHAIQQQSQSQSQQQQQQPPQQQSLQHHTSTMIK